MESRFNLLLLTLFFCCLKTFGQENIDSIKSIELRKNAVHVALGYAGLMGAYNINYERRIAVFHNSPIKGLWAKLGIGSWGVWSSGGPYQSLAVGLLTGDNSSHFELNLGGARMFDKSAYKHEQSMRNYFSEPQPSNSSYVNPSIVGAMGYRYQKPGGNFIFRCGIGYPETVYVGLGAAF